MLKRWKQISSRVLYQNPWWTYKLDTFQIPGGIQGEYHYVFTEGSCIIIPITDAGQIILVKQYRYLNRRDGIEFACGSIKPGSTYLETAQHELAEETGFRAEVMHEVGTFNPYKGIACEMSKVFVAEGLQPAPAQPDATEEFELVYCTVEEVDALIATNELWDGMSMAAWILARAKVVACLEA